MFKKAKHLIEALFTYIYFFVCYLLPIEVASYISGKLVETIGSFLKVNKVAHKNLSLCLPNLSEVEKRIIIKKMWNNLGRILGEIPHWQSMSKEEYYKRVTLKDYSNGMFKQEKRGLFISAHYGNWEIFPRFLNEQNLNFSLVYRPANNPYVDNIINGARRKQGIDLIKKGVSGIRKIVENLKSDHLVGMLVDQKTNDGIEIPFFGRLAKTTPAPANLALKFNAPIYLACITRKKGATYQIEFFSPLEISSGDDTYSIMCKINAEIERWILLDPSQWFWVHKRWDKEVYKS